MRRPAVNEAIPQDVALRLQLAAFAGGQTDGYFEIRSRRTRGRPGMDQEFIPVRELDRAARRATNRGQMTDTYLGAAVRTRRAGGLDAIERLSVLWAECDGPDALQHLAHFRPLPAIVIRSGRDHGAHAYWPLCHPVPPKWGKRLNLRLAVALGADRNATDGARILRPAGTLNFKYGTPRPVTCTRLTADVFEFGDVVGSLPDDPASTPKPPRPPQPHHPGAIPSRTLDGLARKVREAPGPPNGNRNAALYWAACRLREHTAAGRLDIADGRGALRDAALAAGLDEHETDRTLDSALHAASTA